MSDKQPLHLGLLLSLLFKELRVMGVFPYNLLINLLKLKLYTGNLIRDSIHKLSIFDIE